MASDRNKQPPPDYLLVTCAGCGKELSANKDQAEKYQEQLGKDEKAPPLVHGRIRGRPYCGGCLEFRRIPERSAPAEPGNSWDNTVRTAEGGE